MPLYRVTGIHASSHRDSELYIDAASPEVAINTARRRSLLSPAIEAVEGGIAPPGSAVIVKTRDPATALRERPIRTIAYGVFFGGLLLIVAIAVFLGMLRGFVPSPPV
ncbi:MAG: hypothetical protein JJU33_13225 [Phycisphaerales bacterium]|nr:hypothetical protein [Phycisphaerales bacterium]